MFQFTRDHGNSKKGDRVESHPYSDYLLRVGVLEEVKEETYTDEPPKIKQAKKEKK